MFRKCTSLTSLDISHFNTSSATVLAYNFML
jgi:surface protein